MQYQSHELDWQGCALFVRYCPCWLKSHLDHIEVESRDRQPLPITETGYRSIFVSPEILAEWGGALAYVAAMLDAEAQRPEWLAAQAQRQQFSLF